jgi:hypothetical protein
VRGGDTGTDAEALPLDEGGDGGDDAAGDDADDEEAGDPDPPVQAPSTAQATRASTAPRPPAARIPRL